MPLSPTATREALARLGLRPKRFLGQNFLIDGNIVRKSLELAQVRPGDRVVEIGPGLGTLTAALLEAGAEVWAVEKDRQLHAHLEETLAPKFRDALHLMEGDALEHPLAGLPSEPTLPAADHGATTGHQELRPDPVSGFKIVANLPYAISTPWLDAVLDGRLPARMVLMLQTEAAQRYAATPGTKQFGAISIFLQSAYTFEPGHLVAAACFFPAPEVDSQLLHLARRPAPFVFAPEIKALIRACFQQRRKQIGAALRQRLPDQGRAWLEILDAAGHGPRSRAEEIPVELWQELA